MDSFPFKDNFGASMDNSIDLDDKDLDDAINNNFLPFVDLEEAINNLDDVINGNFLPFKDLEEAINDDFFSLLWHIYDNNICFAIIDVRVMDSGHI